MIIYKLHQKVAQKNTAITHKLLHCVSDCGIMRKTKVQYVVKYGGIIMLYDRNYVDTQYGSGLRVAEAVRTGSIYRIDRGLYSDVPNVSPFAIISAKYPNAIITMDTAFYIHGLTDVIPCRIYLATRRNATRITRPDIVQVFLCADIFEQGKVQMEYEDTEITIYNKERMLIEAMRNSKTMPFDYYKEIISSYRRISGKLDYQAIEEYIGVFKQNEYMFRILQREVL